MTDDTPITRREVEALVKRLLEAQGRADDRDWQELRQENVELRERVAALEQERAHRREAFPGLNK